MSVGNHSIRQWLLARGHLGIRPGLSRMREVLSVLGHPELQLHVVHVAGTNGKGSVSAVLAAVLKGQRRVGLFTSPGWNGLSAQFEIVGEDVLPSELEQLLAEVEQAERRATPDDLLTQFEALTVMALLYFARKRVDTVILEAGLGGRLDATNVVTPVLSVITNVGLDHQAILGHTLSAIAAEKSGIIKYGVPLITGARGVALLKILQMAQQQSAPVYVCGVHFDGTFDRLTSSGYILTYRGMTQDVAGLKTAFQASYQETNVAVALAAVEVLTALGEIAPVSVRKLRTGLLGVAWPGRFEVRWYQQRPIVLDGAHNPAGSQALCKSLQEFQRLWKIQSEDWVCVVGVLADKDVFGIIQAMSPFLRRVIVCEPENSRALAAEKLVDVIGAVRENVDVVVVPQVGDAMQVAWEYPGPVCCFGSLYTVEPARKAIDTLVS